MQEASKKKPGECISHRTALTLRRLSGETLRVQRRHELFHPCCCCCCYCDFDSPYVTGCLVQRPGSWRRLIKGITSTWSGLGPNQAGRGGIWEFGGNSGDFETSRELKPPFVFSNVSSCRHSKLLSTEAAATDYLFLLSSFDPLKTFFDLMRLLLECHKNICKIHVRNEQHVLYSRTSRNNKDKK